MNVLMQECLSNAIQTRGVICATLHVDPDNVAARNLYIGLDFVCDSLMQDYYAPGRDCWKMLKDL